MSDVNQAAELTHLRERVKELLSDIRVLRAEVEAWRSEYNANEERQFILDAVKATDARNIMTNPLYQTPTNQGENAQ